MTQTRAILLWGGLHLLAGAALAQTAAAGVTTPHTQAPQQMPPRPGAMPNAAAAASREGSAPKEDAAPRKAPEEKTVVTHHSAKIGGAVINYTATAGTLVMKADNGTPKASFFYVAYTKDGVSDPSTRPVSFVYNGGPGSG